MRNKFVYYSVVLSAMLLFVGCSKYHYFYSPDCVEAGDSASVIENQPTNGKWFYANDSIMVYNANLDRIDRLNVKNRVFSSKDVEMIRKELSIPNEYFWIIEGDRVTLSNKRAPNEKTFEIIQTQNRHFFYVYIPCQIKKWGSTKNYLIEIPITYIDTTIIIHTQRTARWDQESVRRKVSADIEMEYVEKWLIRCKQGKKFRPRTMRNKSARYI